MVRHREQVHEIVLAQNVLRTSPALQPRSSRIGNIANEASPRPPLLHDADDEEQKDDSADGDDADQDELLESVAQPVQRGHVEILAKCDALAVREGEQRGVEGEIGRGCDDKKRA